MLEIEGYTVTGILRKTPTYTIYRLLSSIDNVSYTAKALNQENHDSRALARLRNEYTIHTTINAPAIYRAHTFIDHHTSPILILEDSQGVPLNKFFNRRLDIKKFLPLALHITEALQDIHAHAITHKAINSSNIIYDKTSKTLKIVDFGFATRVQSERTSNYSDDLHELNLAFISPEQTGRMNRSLDYRSDYYSLGVVFYWLTTGILPFNTDDTTEMIHGHIAKVPRRPDDVIPTIPKPLSDCIMKLLEKKAEDRYQSMSTLRRDLMAFNGYLTKQSVIPPYSIAENDIPEFFTVPQKLYGRETEVAQLKEIYARVCDGSRELLLIKGSSGVGKTSLAEELHKEVAQKKGLYISGNFNQLVRDIPYGSIVNSFRAYLPTLLASPKEIFQERKESILKALGGNGDLIISVIPELESIIGPQPRVLDINLSESRNRFQNVFLNFILSFASEVRPLVLFLDNLQWADSATLECIESLINSINSRNILIAGSYRDNEVKESHALQLAINEIIKSGSPINHIELQPLALDSVVTILTDTFHTNPDAVHSLAEISHKKSNGTPFFLFQFLSGLNNEQCIWFDYKKGQWQWDVEKIKSQKYTDNVVELMKDIITQLAPQSQEILQRASCYGTGFSLQQVMELSDLSRHEVEHYLWPCLKHGLIIPGQSSPQSQAWHQMQYEFGHDRIQETCYEMLSSSEKKEVHYIIAQNMHSIIDAGGDISLFNMLNHYSHCLEFIQQEQQKERLITLFIQAGKESKNSAAYKVAFRYLSQALFLMEDSYWKTHRTIALALHQHLCESAFLSGDWEGLERYSTTYINYSDDLIQAVPIHEMRILALISQDKSREAVLLALPVLNALGMKLPAKPSKIELVYWMLRTKIALSRRSIPSLEHLPMMEDVQLKAALRISASIASAAYTCSKDLFPIIIFRQILIILKHGSTPMASFAYANFGLIQCAIFNAFNKGYAYGELALRLLEKYESKEETARTTFIVNTFILHYRDNIKENSYRYFNAQKIGLETGDFEYAAYSLAAYGYQLYHQGEELSKFEGEMSRNLKFSQQLKQDIASGYMHLYIKAAKQLQHGFDFEELTELNQSTTHSTRINRVAYNRHYIANRYSLSMMLSYYNYQYDKAVELSNLAEQYLDAIIGFINYPQFFFFRTLLNYKLLQMNASNKSSTLKKIAVGRQKFKRWASGSPLNYRHQFELLEAEWYASHNQFERAVYFYEQAIQSALQTHSNNILALVYELYGEFWINQNKLNLAQHFLERSYHSYHAWGAHAKCLRMMEIHPHLKNASFFDQKNMSTSIAMDLDIDAVLKAAQIISKEIVLEKLVGNLLKIVIENAGAQKGLFFIKKSDGWFRAGTATSVGDNIDITITDAPLRENDLEFPETVINYILRSKTQLTYNKETGTEPFINDPYIVHHDVQSIYCIPLLNKDSPIGILYLENNLISQAFTQARTKLLEVLSGEIAISIENANLYQSLEQHNSELEAKVDFRTKELKKLASELMVTNEKIDNLVLNILPSQVAEDLKEQGRTEPKLFDNVTVYFSDIVGFTDISSTLVPHDLINELNDIFTEYDRIMYKYGCERIKTIGDAYLAVCGMPNADINHSTNIVDAALEIIEYMKNRDGLIKWKIRIGLHTGSVVGGVVGVTKYIYDVFGDTINMASRMETYSEPMKINISQKLFENISDQYTFTKRGPIRVKGIGTEEMYFVEGRTIL